MKFRFTKKFWRNQFRNPLFYSIANIAINVIIVLFNGKGREAIEMMQGASPDVDAVPIFILLVLAGIIFYWVFFFMVRIMFYGFLLLAMNKSKSLEEETLFYIKEDGQFKFN